MEGLLKSMHKGTRHNGKAPAIWKKKKDYVDQLHELESLLNKSIVKEDYEKAADLRDKIASVKEEYTKST